MSILMELINSFRNRFNIDTSQVEDADVALDIIQQPPKHFLNDPYENEAEQSTDDEEENDNETDTDSLYDQQWLFERLVHQRQQDMDAWAIKRKKQSVKLNAKIRSYYFNRLSEEFDISYYRISELALLFKAYFWNITQVIHLPEDKYKAQSFSTWKPEILDRYIPETSMTWFTPHVPVNLQTTDMLIHVKRQFKLLLSTLFHVQELSEDETGLQRLEADNVNETCVRMFVDAWLLELIHTVNNRSTEKIIQSLPKLPIMAHVEWKCAVREGLLSSGAMDYVFTRGGKVVCVVETKRGHKQMMQQGLTQGVVEALTLQEKYAREQSDTDTTTTTVPPSPIVVISSNGYRYIFAVVGPKGIKLSKERVAETWDDLLQIMAITAALLDMS